ncbi:MAG: hypothetical protein E7470_06395 [Ruminococcaceae bacterium]|nr:hypothetical protein [Oscillospiraceae bacterium]
MKKILSIALCCLLLCALAVSAMAASDGPVITLQPQSPTYTQYDVALYIVKAEGTNLTATWYLDWLGQTYNISDTSGAMQDWEPYAGETYGPQQPDANTFTYTFGGIEYDMDGAHIWCVIEDGHNTVTSQKVRVSVKDFGAPPSILEIPAQVTVEQGAEAEIRCVATSPAEDVQLTYRWFETTTGSMNDISAVTDAQQSDSLKLDTSVVGTRNYVCQVSTSDGGIAYSSIVPVTVTEKTPDLPTENPDDTEPDNSQPTESTEQKQPTDETKPAGNEQDKPQKDNGAPWWSLVLVGLAAAGAGVGVAVLLVKKKA